MRGKRNCKIKTNGETVGITPRCIRHNYATVCWERGIDPYTTMHLMGHSSIKTTMDIYAHLNERQMARISQKIDGLFEKLSCTN